jgi:TolB-like protein
MRASGSTILGTKSLLLLLLLQAGIASAQPVIEADNAILSYRGAALAPNPYRYEPILIQPSVTPSGQFNSGLIFVAEQIDRNVSPEDRQLPTVFNTIVNLNDLSETSPFGRLVGEHLIHELQVRGWPVSDIRLSKDLIINGSGEFSLSRDLKRIRELMPAVNVVTGTYMSTRDGVLLNIRVLNLETGRIVSTAQTRLFRDKFLAALIDKPVVIPNVRITN